MNKQLGWRMWRRTEGQLTGAAEGEKQLSGCQDTKHMPKGRLQPRSLVLFLGCVAETDQTWNAVLLPILK